jgi:protein-S-isoprenylcysteine O-methyltransferase Ste14
MGSKIISILGLIAAIAGLFILYKHGYFFSPNPITIIIQLFAAVLMIWARLTFGARSFHVPANATKGELVTHGPYRWMRNPIYTAIILFAWACVIAYPFLITVIAATLITIGQGTRAFLEEQFLFATYPAYSEYAKKTKRFIPFIF